MNLNQTIDLLAQLHYRTVWNGLNVSIENKKGSYRSGVDKDGKAWSQKQPWPYGYLSNAVEGHDGDKVDVYLGPDPKAKKVYIVHINVPDTDKYDEDKCMLNFSSREQAMKAFREAYDKPDRFFRSLSVMSVEDFKNKVTDKSNNGKKLAAMGYTIDPISTFRSPNSKLKRVPTDDPGETDDEYMDVTKRNSKETIKEKMKLLTNKGVRWGINTADREDRLDTTYRR